MSRPSWQGVRKTWSDRRCNSAKPPEPHTMHFSLQGKTAIVTGGASGIGLAIVKRLIAAGARVLAADRRLAGADIAKAAGAEFFQADVSQEEQIAAMFDAAKTGFG